MYPGHVRVDGRQQATGLVLLQAQQNLLQLKSRNPFAENELRLTLAVRTRLELATSAVTGRRSNQTELPDQLCAKRAQ